MTIAHRKKISESLKGRTAWNKGKECDYKHKISQRRKGKGVGNKNAAGHKPTNPFTKGKHPWNWKGGISRGYKTGYYSEEYRNWRTMVFLRDHHTCQGCGISGDKAYLTAHHIKSFAHYPELRFDISNGQTLCELCHSKTDNFRGRAKKGHKHKI